MKNRYIFVALDNMTSLEKRVNQLSDEGYHMVQSYPVKADGVIVHCVWMERSLG